MTEAEQIVTVEQGRVWGEMVAAAWWALREGGMTAKAADRMVELKFATTYVTMTFDPDDD